MLPSIHAYSDDALGTLDAVGVTHAIADARISATEAHDAALARAASVDSRLRAIAHLIPQSAPQTPQGALGGVPTFVKDNTRVAGLPARSGSHAVPTSPARTDAAVTATIRATGMGILGISRMPEFGFNATTEFETEPPTRNPWDPAFSPGASSGGAAALVAAGVVPIAHGNDGGGSIRIPAAACGLVGLKATRGRIAKSANATTMPVNIISDGVLTRTVRDTAAFWAAVDARRPDRRLPTIGHVTGPGPRRRIGVLLDSVTDVPTDARIRQATVRTADLLADAGHIVQEIQPPVDRSFADDFLHYWSMLAFAAQHAGKLSFGRGFDASQTEGFTRSLAQRFWRRSIATPAVIARLRASAARVSRAFDAQGIDTMLSPVVASTTPELGYLSPAVDFNALIDRLVGFVSFTPLANASGQPAISVPVASSPLPIGVQLSARHGHERTLLELAYELEEMQPAV